MTTYKVFVLFFREIGGEITQDGDFYIFESNRYRNGFLYKNMAMSGVVSPFYFIFNFIDLLENDGLLQIKRVYLTDIN